MKILRRVSLWGIFYIKILLKNRVCVFWEICVYLEKTLKEVAKWIL